MIAHVAAMALSALLLNTTTVGHHIKPRHHHKLPTAEASWYDDSGTLCCGERNRAYYGIADRTLAMGTRVTLCHSGRCVVARVDDRGPYIYSRLFDLNANTKAAISCPDLCTVAYRVW